MPEKIRPDPSLEGIVVKVVPSLFRSLIVLKQTQNGTNKSYISGLELMAPSYSFSELMHYSVHLQLLQQYNTCGLEITQAVIMSLKYL